MCYNWSSNKRAQQVALINAIAGSSDGNVTYRRLTCVLYCTAVTAAASAGPNVFYDKHTHMDIHIQTNKQYKLTMWKPERNSTTTLNQCSVFWGVLLDFPIIFNTYTTIITGIHVEWRPSTTVIVNTKGEENKNLCSSPFSPFINIPVLLLPCCRDLLCIDHGLTGPLCWHFNAHPWAVKDA